MDNLHILRVALSSSSIHKMNLFTRLIGKEKNSRSENNSNEHKMAIEDRQTFEIGNYSLSLVTLR